MHIVIVDDNRVNVALLKALARQLSEVPSVDFTDPVPALQWCLSNDFDLLLVDYMMPVIDGLSFIEQLRLHQRGGQRCIAGLDRCRLRIVRHREVCRGARRGARGDHRAAQRGHAGRAAAGACAARPPAPGRTGYGATRCRPSG